MKKLFFLVAAICFSTAMFANQIDVDYKTKFNTYNNLTNNELLEEEYFYVVCDFTITHSVGGKMVTRDYHVGDYLRKDCAAVEKVLRDKLQIVNLIDLL